MGLTVSQIEAMTPEQISEAILEVAKHHPGFSGNCAAFAVVLNRVLGGHGDYVIVDGGHYEFADHVAVEIRGHVFDADGLTTREALLERWGEAGDEDDDEEIVSSVEDFPDETPNGDSVRRLADQAGCLGPTLDEDEMEEELMEALVSVQPHAAKPSP